MADIFTIPLPPNVETLVSQLADDEEIRSFVGGDGIPTTRGSYGRWMALLPQLAEAQPFGSPTASRRFWAVVLDRAGADRQGLRDALRILEGAY